MIGSVKVALISPMNVSETKSIVKYLPQAKIFQSKVRHSNVLPEELGERWHIGTEQAREKIDKTTQKTTRSVVITLARQYKAERVFHTKRPTGIWATDTMDGRVKYLDGNQYAQVFYNGTYFAEIYPMAKKPDLEQAPKKFVMELGVPEELTDDGLKEQNIPGNEFMKC